MIAYFPNPYKNESIYSIIARYGHHIGLKSKREVLLNLFNSNIRVFPDQLQKMDELSFRINHFNDSYTKEYLEMNYTSLPFYRPFIEQESQNDLIESAILRWSKEKKMHEVHTKEHLYYCTQCLKEQIELIGEGYWNRIFQIPGVLVCPIHSKCLNFHPLNIVMDPLNRLEVPKKDLLKVEGTYMDQAIINNGLEFAENIKYFFKNHVNIGISEVYERYLQFCKVLEIYVPMSKLKKKINDLIASKFCEEFLTLIKCNPRINNWVEKLFSAKQIYKLHPVRHVLLMMTLAGSVKNFYENEPMFKPFGEGPWVCMNPLSEHYLEYRVTKVEIHIHQAKRNYQGDFTCDCGYSYRLRHGEKGPLGIKNFSNRIVEKGAIWEKEFKRLVNLGLTINKIAELTGLSRPTIRKILKEGPDPILNGIRDKKQKVIRGRKQKTDDYRIIWKKIRENNPNLSRKELAGINRAAYAWLNKFDSDWLEENSPVSLLGKNKKADRDFISEDEWYLTKLVKINEEWLEIEKAAGKLIRRTRNGFCKRVGLVKPRKMYMNYPKLSLYIEANVETIEEFQKRKLISSLKTDFNDKYVSRYKLTEKSGIRKSIKVDEGYIEELILKHNSNLSSHRKQGDSAQ